MRQSFPLFAEEHLCSKSKYMKLEQENGKIITDEMLLLGKRSLSKVKVKNH